jgi:hypothetical protein
VAQGVGPEFKTQYHKQNKTKQKTSLYKYSYHYACKQGLYSDYFRTSSTQKDPPHQVVNAVAMCITETQRRGGLYIFIALDVLTTMQRKHLFYYLSNQ